MNRSSVNAWLAGDARAIRAVNWVRMLPYLRQYLPAEEITSDEVMILPEDDRLLEEFRRRIQDAVMASDLDDATKVKSSVSSGRFRCRSSSKKVIRS